MSVCFKCDACGKLYHPYTEHANQTNSLTLTGTWRGLPDDEHKIIETYDLCQDCLSKILVIIPYTEEEEEDGDS